jgi:hypothetical protein
VTPETSRSSRDAAADIADARLQATALATQASSNLAAKDKKFAEDILVSDARFGFGADMGPIIMGCVGVRGVC